MAAQFPGEIGLTVAIKNQSALKKLTRDIKNIERVFEKLSRKPIDDALNLKPSGRGADRDARGVAVKKLNDQLRELTNSFFDARNASNSLQKANALAKARTDAFGTTLGSARQKADDFSRAINILAADSKNSLGSEEVKRLAQAWAEATRTANAYADRLEDVRRRGLGLQPQDVRGAQVERRRRFVRERTQNPQTDLRSLSAVKQRLEYQKDSAELIAKQLQLEDKILRANVSKASQQAALNQLQRASNALQNGELQLAKQITREAEKQLDIDRQRKRTALQRRDNIRNIRRERRQGRTSSALLGAGFPLLFGGGAGSVLGGLAGGLAGGAGPAGFGLQIAGSAIGQIVDQFVADLGNLGDALGSASGAVEELSKRNLFSSKASEDLANKLIRQGRFTEAAALASEELTKALGPDAVRQLKELDKVTDKLNGEWQKLTIQLGLLIAGPLTQFLGLVNSLLQGVGQAGSFRQLERLNRDNEAYQQRRSEFLSGGRTPRVSQEGQRILLEEFGTSSATASVTPSPAELEREAEDRRSRDEKARKDAEAQLRRLIGLEKDILGLQKQRQDLYIRAAETFGGVISGAERILQLQERQYETDVKILQAERAIALLGVTNQVEQTRINQLYDGRLTLLRQQKDFETAITEQKRKQAEFARAEDLIAQRQQGQDQRTAIERSVPLNPFLSDVERVSIERERERADLVREQTREREKLNRTIQAEKGTFTQDEIDNATDKLKVLNEEASKTLFAFDAATQKILEFEQSKVVFEGIQQAINGVAGAVGSLLTEGLRDFIEGTKTAQEVFATFLRTIADALLKAAAEMIATYIAIGIARQFAGLGGGTTTGQGSTGFGAGFPDLGAAAGIPGINREVGGRTMANMPYVVGEKGAELFVPGKTGTVVPADVFEATRQAIAGNGPEGGDSDAFAQNSVALGNTATITKEKSLVREMGMRENEPIDVRYESTVINNVSYVSEEQFQKGLRTAVAQSKASVFSDLKNKPASRSAIGI